MLIQVVLTVYHKFNKEKKYADKIIEKKKQMNKQIVFQYFTRKAGSSIQVLLSSQWAQVVKMTSFSGLKLVMTSVTNLRRK